MEAGKTESWPVAHSPIRYLELGPMKALDKCNFKRSNPENFLRKVTWTSLPNQVHFARFNQGVRFKLLSFQELEKKRRTNFINVKTWR